MNVNASKGPFFFITDSLWQVYPGQTNKKIKNRKLWYATFLFLHFFHLLEEWTSQRSYLKPLRFFFCWYQLGWKMPHQMNSFSESEGQLLSPIFFLTILHLIKQKLSLTFTDGCFPSLSFCSCGETEVRESFSLKFCIKEKKNTLINFLLI